MAKMGRPAVENPKDHKISIRFEESDYARIKETADRDGRPVAETVRNIVLAYLDTRKQ